MADLICECSCVFMQNNEWNCSRKRGADCLLFVKRDRCGIEWYGWRCIISNWMGTVHNAADDFTHFMPTSFNNLPLQLTFWICVWILGCAYYIHFRWLIACLLACLLEQWTVHICDGVVNKTDILLKTYVNIFRGFNLYAMTWY